MERQYQIFARNAPGSFLNRQKFVEGIVIAGTGSLETLLGMMDVIINQEIKSGTRSRKKAYENAWRHAASTMDPARTVEMVEKAKNVFRSIFDKPSDAVTTDRKPRNLRVVRNNVTPMKKRETPNKPTDAA